MCTRHNRIAVRVSISFFLHVVFVKVAAFKDIRISPVAQELFVTGIFIVPAEKRNVERGVHGLRPIGAVQLACAESAYWEKNASTGFSFQRGVHQSQFFACAPFSFRHHLFDRCIVGESQIGAVGRKYTVEGGLAVVVQVDISAIHHVVFHIPHAIHAAAGR